MICLRKKGVKGGVSSKEGNVGHFLQFWGVFSLLHPLKVLTIPNLVWNAYQSSFWKQQGSIDPSGRNFFHLFLAVDHSNPLLAQFHLPGGGPVVIFQHYLISHFQLVFLNSDMPLCSQVPIGGCFALEKFEYFCVPKWENLANFNQPI